MADPTEIWLQPWCDKYECAVGECPEGRMWCQDDVWGECEATDCDNKSVRYVMAGES